MQELDRLKKAFARLEPLGLRVDGIDHEPVMGSFKPHALVTAAIAGRALDLVVEVRRFLRPTMLGSLIMQLKRYENAADLPRPARGLLVADHVTPQMADSLREQDVFFADTAGNAYINAPPVYLFIKGERPAKPSHLEAYQGRAFRSSGLQVIFAILCRPELVNSPYRELAKLTGVAHGTVGWVMADLIDQGYLFKHKRHRRLRDHRKLFEAWTEAYARELRPKLLLGCYEPPTQQWWRQVEAERYAMQWGGEAAAARMTGHLKPGVATLYVDDLPVRFLVEQGLKKVERGGLEFRKKFWHFDQDEQGSVMDATVPPLLVYADLLATGDARNIETAGMIYEEALAGLIGKA